MVAARPAVCLWDSVCLGMANCRWTKATSVGGFGRLLEVSTGLVDFCFWRRKTEDGRRGTRGWSKVRAGCLPAATTGLAGRSSGLGRRSRAKPQQQQQQQQHKQQWKPAASRWRDWNPPVTLL
ncbi:hypothetical protein E4U43_000847 [Claviceps pusilla]|uniref:Uncharacterized protein n=1 Tax=Claviceps pusilla TaxID=123648 RepID=A0A9P7NI97_9HYPO|nr:hypothetical protein E4U43_000847 [Claviceps pusilla]